MYLSKSHLDSDFIKAFKNKFLYYTIILSDIVKTIRTDTRGYDEILLTIKIFLSRETVPIRKYIKETPSLHGIQYTEEIQSVKHKTLIKKIHLFTFPKSLRIAHFNLSASSILAHFLVGARFMYILEYFLSALSSEDILLH